MSLKNYFGRIIIHCCKNLFEKRDAVPVQCDECTPFSSKHRKKTNSLLFQYKCFESNAKRKKQNKRDIY